MSSYQIEPDVVGLWGDDMDFDANRDPQLVGPFHYAIDIWTGQDLVTTDPFLFVTRRLADAIQAAGLTGVEYAPVKVTPGEQGQLVDDNTPLPDLVQFVFTGNAADDLYLFEDVDLRVSARAMALLRDFNLGCADVEQVD
ncbi:MAG: hypothetical protein ACRDTJ_22920 [Pseudonocardiaceae bacterium]